jgi:2-polyprenyl-3-methyl-5-hydroxy-6-metoxy-1,4-benzoquinol methylase
MEWWPFGAGSCRKFYKRRSLERSMPSPVPIAGSSSIEEARIRAAYAKRQKDDTRYSYFSMSNLFMKQVQEQRLLTLLKRHDFAPLNTKKILEVGCGTGSQLREFIKWGARPENITGIDLLVDRIAEAKYLCPEA